MKALLPLSILFIFGLFFGGTIQAQDCDAGFDITISTSSALTIRCVPSESLESVVGYQWLIDGEPVSMGATLTHTFAESGDYEICLNAFTSEGDTCTQCIVICVNVPTDGGSGTSSVGSFGSEKNTFSVFPNPSKDQLIISFNSEKIKTFADMKIEFTTMEGRIVSSIPIKSKKGINEIPVDLSGLSTGVYLIHITGAYQFEAVKFVKQ